MLSHVDMIYLAKQAKRDVEKALLWDENRNQIESRKDFLPFYVKYADVLLVLAQNKSIYTWHVHDSPYSTRKIGQIMFYEGINVKVFEAQYRLRHRGSCNVTL